MGELNIHPVVRTTDLREYTSLLFKDVDALEAMISRGMIEEGVQRMGAEQELCLTDKHGAPAFLAEEILTIVSDPHFTTELAKFNLEINLDPLELGGNCLSLLEKDLRRLLNICNQACESIGCQVLLTGILPTLRSGDLRMENMTPRQRYRALNTAILEMRQSPQKFHIQGTDELSTTSDSVMFESCNTSFQIHFQVSAENFTSHYNWAQAIAGPILAVCANSPLFLGKRLWSETRIALFQQATDTRGYQEELRRTKPRVIFGESWMKKDITGFIKQDLSTFRPLVVAEGIENSLQQLSDGIIPTLKAFSLFNGSIYRWNRPCYGITDGKPHLRIENRYLPAGPSVLDEVANAALWIGLMNSTPDVPSPEKYMEFHEVKTNFIRAARHGLAARLSWMGNEYDARELIIEELLPLARNGLGNAGVQKEDVEKYLNIIHDRVDTAKTGSTWILKTYNELIKSNSQYTVLSAITEAIKRRQQQDQPVHQWPSITAEEIEDGAFRYQLVIQIMSHELYTVYEEDLIDLVPNIMKWNQVRHMLVENREGDLVGLVTLGRLGKYYSEQIDSKPVMVKEVMVKEVITVTPDTATLEAIRLMRQHRIGCLPVLNHHRKLVGVVTERDLLPVAASYLSADQSQ